MYRRQNRNGGGVFYASLLNSLTPDYTWDNNYGYININNKFIINDGAYLSPTDNGAILYDCTIPIRALNGDILHHQFENSFS